MTSRWAAAHLLPPGVIGALDVGDLGTHSGERLLELLELFEGGLEGFFDLRCLLDEGAVGLAGGALRRPSEAATSRQKGTRTRNLEKASCSVPSIARKLERLRASFSCIEG